MAGRRSLVTFAASVVFLLLCSIGSARAQLPHSSKPPVGPGNVIVTPALGGDILGFDIDQDGSEGLLSEFKMVGKTCPYATETFDQKTGKIVQIIRQGTDCADSDVTRGIVGSSVGLVEHDHSLRVDYFKATFQLLDPLEGNQFTGSWTPPGNERSEIWATSRNQGATVTAFQFLDLNSDLLYAGGSYVAQNQFGPAAKVAVTPFIIGFNTKTNTAVLAYADAPFGPTTLVLVDVVKGTQTTLQGIGSGIEQGIAVDSADNIAVITTYGDAGVEFYDLATGGVIAYEVLPNCFSPACSGFDVEFDPIHRLFLVAQPITSQEGNETSTIYVYDTQGNLQETLNGFNFYTQRFDAIPVHIALHPSDRSGFVDVTNSTGVGAIQSFTY